MLLADCLALANSKVAGVVNFFPPISTSRIADADTAGQGEAGEYPCAGFVANAVWMRSIYAHLILQSALQMMPHACGPNC